MELDNIDTNEKDFYTIRDIKFVKKHLEKEHRRNSIKRIDKLFNVLKDTECPEFMREEIKLKIKNYKKRIILALKREKK